MDILVDGLGITRYTTRTLHASAMLGPAQPTQAQRSGHKRTVYGDLSIYGCASFTSALQRASTSGPCLACSIDASIDASIDKSRVTRETYQSIHPSYHLPTDLALHPPTYQAIYLSCSVLSPKERAAATTSLERACMVKGGAV